MTTNNPPMTAREKAQKLLDDYFSKMKSGWSPDSDSWVEAIEQALQEFASQEVGTILAIAAELASQYCDCVECSSENFEKCQTKVLILSLIPKDSQGRKA